MTTIDQKDVRKHTLMPPDPNKDFSEGISQLKQDANAQKQNIDLNKKREVITK